MTTTTAKTKNNTSKPATPRPKKVIEDLPVNPFAFEVFDLISRQKSNAKKVELLQKHGDLSIKALFIWNFDESLVSLLPEGDVPYASTGEQIGRAHV